MVTYIIFVVLAFGATPKMFPKKFISDDEKTVSQFFVSNTIGVWGFWKWVQKKISRAHTRGHRCREWKPKIFKIVKENFGFRKFFLVKKIKLSINFSTILIEHISTAQFWCWVQTRMSRAYCTVYHIDVEHRDKCHWIHAWNWSYMIKWWATPPRAAPLSSISVFLLSSVMCLQCGVTGQRWLAAARTGQATQNGPVLRIQPMHAPLTRHIASGIFKWADIQNVIVRCTWAIMHVPMLGFGTFAM